jgi:hypothetical protein
MYSRVKKVLIGKDISRTASLVSIYNSSTVPAAGEVLVLDKNKKILTAGKTVVDTDTIFIAEALSTTGVRSFIFSDPIEGAGVKSYSGKSYAARVQRTTTLGYVSQTITAGDEYVLRIVYKDVKEHPGQKTQTYRHIATTSGSDDLYTALAAKINRDDNSRITATVNSVGSNTDTLTLTAKAIPECTTGLTDIDEFRMVDFEVFFYWIDLTASTYHGLGPFQVVTLNGGDITYTGVTYPKGSWEMVRDAEKHALGQQFGVTNRIWFPVKQPAFRTDITKTYDEIVIEHDGAFLTPDNGYTKSARHETCIFLPVSCGQGADILGVLNPWMASTPGAFTAVSI